LTNTVLGCCLVLWCDRRCEVNSRRGSGLERERGF
jgi:hypothetical protein